MAPKSVSAKQAAKLPYRRAHMRQILRVSSIHHAQNPSIALVRALFVGIRVGGGAHFYAHGRAHQVKGFAEAPFQIAFIRIGDMV